MKNFLATCGLTVLAVLALVFNSAPAVFGLESKTVVAKETAKDARTATVKVYHDSKYRSFLEIPVAR